MFSSCHPTPTIPAPLLPLRVFLSFFPDDKTSAADVFSSSSYISYYGYEIWRQAIFEWKWMLFQLLSTIKVKLVDEIMQSAYLCIIWHVKNRKLPFIAVLTRFLILGKIQDGGHCWWRHRLPAAPPPNKIYLVLLRRSKAFHWRQNRFEILQHI